MLCDTCGKELASTAKFCGSCGTSVATGQPTAQQTNAAPLSAAAPDPQPTPSTPATPSPQPDPPDVAPLAVSRSLTSPATPQPPDVGSPPLSSGTDPLIALLLGGGGLALTIEAQALTYAFVDDYSAAKPMLILLLIIGLAAAGTGAGLAAARARPQFTADAKLTASMLSLAVGAFGVAYGLLRLLTALGQ